MVHDDPVAQVDRVSVSEAGGHEFDSHRDHIKKINIAKVAKLVDAQASGVCTARREGSSPSTRTKPTTITFSGGCLFYMTTKNLVLLTTP